MAEKAYGPPATGQVLRDLLSETKGMVTTLLDLQLQLAETVGKIARDVETALAAVDRRYKLIDQFIDPALKLQLTLAQLIENQQLLKSAVEQLGRDVRREHNDTRKAVALHMSDPAQEQAREWNGG